MMYIHVFIEMSDHTCINIYVCNVFLKKCSILVVNEVYQKICDWREKISLYHNQYSKKPTTEGSK
jgi:hypothetical protein